VPKGIVVCFAIFLAPNAFSRFSVRTRRIVASGSGGLPSRLPFARAVLSPIIVRSDILAVSCLASVSGGVEPQGGQRLKAVALQSYGSLRNAGSRGTALD